MTYRFHSKATGDVLMLEPAGADVLKAMGFAPARRGIIEPAAMPEAIAALQAAIAADEQPPEEEGAPPPVGLRQRLWPMVEMLRRAHAADAAVVWGV